MIVLLQLYKRLFLPLSLSTMLVTGVEAAVPNVITNSSASWVTGNSVVTPNQGQAGTGNSFNWDPYTLPGQLVQGGQVIGNTYQIAYAKNGQPIQSTDWWAGVGLQWGNPCKVNNQDTWCGWVQGNNPLNPVIRTQSFYNEPFYFDFIDLPDTLVPSPGLALPVHGLRMWNQTDIHVYTGDPNTTNNLFGRGAITGQRSPILTVGLKDVHPVVNAAGKVPTVKPFTNVQIQNYSDWGVTMSYGNSAGELTITMANGSPFTWFERTAGTAPFRIWSGGDIDDVGDNGQPGSMRVWYNQNGVLGITVNNFYNPPGDGKPPHTLNPAAYAVFADQSACPPGSTWRVQRSSGAGSHMALFSNDCTTKVVVAALPHNLTINNLKPKDAIALQAALMDFQSYAWQRITGTQIHYPPISNSATSVTVNIDGKPTVLKLGFDSANSVLRQMLAVTTEDFRTGGAGGNALQMVFPHHRAEMIPQDKVNILMNGTEPKYTWNSLKGELQAYSGNRYVLEATQYGVLPNLPSVAVNSANKINGQVPAQDIYDTLKTWFYLGEPNGPNNSRFTIFSQDIGGWLPGQSNTYVYSLAGVYESLLIADQLMQSTNLENVQDPDLGISQKAVVQRIQANLLDSLKEMVGRWADVYTSGFFQYNPVYDTIYGFPSGYGSVQTLSDKHFHWGYFLKSAAVIGRHDPDWLQAYRPLFTQLSQDVANRNRSNKAYPFLRNFSPFYGHSWADGTANGGLGDNQESTSEAINFAAGLIELAQETGDQQSRDLGLLLYEQEIRGAEQYWFNQNANLTASSGEFYNGNWPDSFVHYQQQSGLALTTPIISGVHQSYVTRAAFFGSDGFNNMPVPLLIHSLPLSASSLYLGCNQQWLAQVWAEFLRENQIDSKQTGYEVILAGVQARLAGNGTAVNDPGPLGALARVNQTHVAYPAAMNTQGKHWAYTLNALGQLDTSVVANKPNYGVFCKGATGANCGGGTRTLVAYNPSGTAQVVNFVTDTDPPTPIRKVTVPPNSMATVVGKSAPTIDTIPVTPNETKLYLTKPQTDAYSCDQAPANTPPMTLSINPGTRSLPEGTTPFPNDISALSSSLVCVPKLPNLNNGAGIPPDATYIRTWHGTFSGSLIAGASQQHTEFAIYTDQSLFPGWQQDPCVAGGPLLPAHCPGYPPGNPAPAANVITFQVVYDFDGNGTTDRTESYVNAPLYFTNAFSYANKLSDLHFYYGAGTWPSQNGRTPVTISGEDFPASVSNGNVSLKMWGGGGAGFPGGLNALYPVPVSVNADPKTNRASWILPPYR